MILSIIKSSVRTILPRSLTLVYTTSICFSTATPARTKLLRWIASQGLRRMAAPGFLESISPWSSRSNTPKPAEQTIPERGPPPTNQALYSQQGGSDHRISHRKRLSIRNYPDDCPPLNVRWFYAVDVPKRKPQALSKKTDKPKPLVQPKKWAPFTIRDSRSIETTLQKLAEEEDVKRNKRISTITGDITDTSQHVQHAFATFGRQGSLRGTRPDLPQTTSTKVPVNEDFLFDVDIDTRELAPAYWLGPIYEVRRGTWFYNDGASNKPCDENLATQLEEGYLKARPWTYEPPVLPTRSSSQTKRPASWKSGESTSKLGATAIKPPRQSSVDAAKSRIREEEAAAAAAASALPAPPKFEYYTHRLFGAHMNSVVTYQDDTTAWIVTDDFLSRMSTTMYQRFAGGGHYGGIKVVRGHIDTSGKKETKVEDAPATADLGETEERGRSMSSQRRAGSQSRDRMPPPSIKIDRTKETGSEKKRYELEQRMTTIIGSPSFEDPAAQEEAARKREEHEIEQDYRDHDDDDQGRDIEHLVLCTHGIGQRLGLKMESLNFIHDVNVLRKTLKSIYQTSPDLQALNSEVEKLPKNCRVQVLPIVWRHLLDFPREVVKKSGKEQDLSDADALDQEMDYPRLQDITVEGVPAIRNLVEDLFLDILLYQSAYRDYIGSIVQRECNRVFKLFMDRNPNFNGKVSLVGHSLGSAIMFDILCRQKQREKAPTAPKRHPSRRSTNATKPKEEPNELALDFDVEDFYALGSPIGLFQMIEGRRIVGRRDTATMENNGTVDHISANDSFRKVSGANAPDESSSILSNISSPKCAQVFNIFHPTDPVAYRVEPLISPAMKVLKAQPLPFIKRGLFHAPVAGLSGIGSRVGQSVSGFWSNITTGVASSLLNRSLGLTNDPTVVTGQTRQPLSLNAAVNLPHPAGPGAAATATDAPVVKDEPKATHAADTGAVAGEHPPTLIDSEIETLYSGFQRRRNTLRGSEDPRENLEYLEAEERAKQYRREEAKVRALNSTGRVDFSIQEGMFDISLIGSLASHLSYWADEDVSHFMISQLLSRQRVVKK